MNVYNSLNTGRYLGLPSLVGRRKKEVFNYIKERLWKKLQGWKGKKLSKVGKEDLIKAAAQAIPSYCMSTFLLSSTLLDDLHVMLNKCWWENGGDSAKGVKWMHWEKMYVRKKAGGRGFRDLHLFNVALLGKMAWRLIVEPNSLVCRLLKARYFLNKDFMTADLGCNANFTWYSIHASQDFYVMVCGGKLEMANLLTFGIYRG